MHETDLEKLRELTLLLDLAYIHYFDGGVTQYKSAEASIRLEFGNIWYRKNHQPEPPGPPEIEHVVIYSSIFSAAPVTYFDTLDEAIEVVRGWYDYAKERKEKLQLED